MKPHFQPGDQVITANGRIGAVVHGFRGETTGAWFYTITLEAGVATYAERQLWHINDTVARERALARKGKTDEPPASDRGTAYVDADGNVGSPWRGDLADALDDRAHLHLSGREIRDEPLAQTEESPPAL